MTNPVRVLAIDGGGVRGVIPARLLAELERRSGQRVAAMFDLVAGTSTGGLLALALSIPKEPDCEPMKASALVRLYQHHGARIFPPSLGRRLKLKRASHSDLAGVVQEYIGDASLSDAVVNVMIPAYEMERRQPFFFKSWKATESGAWDFTAVDAALATCSAPTFFDPWKITPAAGNRVYTLMDGGIFANNPSLCAVIEARKLYPSRPITVVSIGTGDLEERVSEEKAKGWNAFDWSRKGFGIVSDAISDTVAYQLPKLEGVTQLRWTTELPRGAEALDNVDPSNVEMLISLAQDQIRIKSVEIDSFVSAVAE